MSGSPRRNEKALDRFLRHVGRRTLAEEISRTDINDYKRARSREGSERDRVRMIRPRTISFEITALRLLFYFLIASVACP